MKISDVAKLLGTTPLTIRVGLQKGIFPFGVAFKVNESSSHYTYIIYPEKLKEYVNLDSRKNTPSP